MTDQPPVPPLKTSAVGARPPTWVLLRGLARESRHWGSFGQRLAEVLPDATVVALDLPGNGRLNRMTSPTRIESMTQCCRQQLRQQGLKPPYRVLAVSLGGMVAVDWARRYPAELSAGVLVNTSMRPFSPWHARLRPSNLMPLLRLAFANASALDKESLVLALTSRNPTAAAAILDEWASLRVTHPASAANALRQLCAAARFHAPRSAPPVRLLVLCSTLDGLVSPRCSRDLAEAWSAPIAEHPSAGHDLPLDDAPWVVSQIAQWLARVDAEDQ